MKREVRLYNYSHVERDKEEENDFNF